jgi:hypothetical protein
MQESFSCKPQLSSLKLKASFGQKETERNRREEEKAERVAAFQTNIHFCSPRALVRSLLLVWFFLSGLVFGV